MDEIPIPSADQSHHASGGHDLGSSGSLPCSALLPAALEEFGNIEDKEKGENIFLNICFF